MSYAQTIPVIKRSFPRWLAYLAAVPVYLLLVPVNWLLTNIGKPEAFMRRSGWSQGKPEKLRKVFGDYTPDSHDVFVSTFSKSGTNWMMQIAHQVAFRGRGEYEHIHDAVTWPDLGGRRARMAVDLRSDVVRRLSPTGLRVIKTHLSTAYVPYSDKAKYLVVVRDPKELFVSSYHFVGGIAGPLMPALDVWLDLFLTKDFPMNFGNTWAEHTASYWALRERPNVRILSYTGMKRDLGRAVRQVAETMQVQLTPEELASVIERSSFEYMKTIDNKFVPFPKGSLPWAKELSMVRTGKTGNSSELLSREQQQRIDAHFQAELKQLGCDFPYAEFCRIS